MSNLTGDVALSGMTQAMAAYYGASFTDTSDFYTVIIAGPDYDLDINYGTSDALMLTLNVTPGSPEGIPSGSYTVADTSTAEDFYPNTALSGIYDPTYGGYGAPEGDPIQGDIMLISADEAKTTEARYTVKGLLGKQVLYTARQEGSVLTLDFPENVATFRATILDLQTLMNNGVSTVVLQTNKASTTLNLTLLCDGYSANDKVVLRHIGSRACLTVKGRSRRDLLIGR